MSYKLRPDEKLSHGIRRIARKQVCSILKALREKRPECQGEAIHKARKGVKEVRALLRLVRCGLGQDTYRRENRSFRKVGHGLSQRRDAGVLLATLDKLRRQNHGETADALFSKLEDFLLRRQEDLYSGGGDWKQGLEDELRTARRRVRRWPLEKLKWADLCPGMKKTCKQGLKAVKEARRAGTMENLHEWRKRVKDLGYELRLLEPVQPRALAKLARKAKLLGEHLGDDHDLAMLEEAARAGLDRKEWEKLSSLIGPRRAELQRATFELGRRLYAAKPAAFARRIKC